MAASRRRDIPASTPAILSLSPRRFNTYLTAAARLGQWKRRSVAAGGSVHVRQSVRWCRTAALHGAEPMRFQRLALLVLFALAATALPAAAQPKRSLVIFGDGFSFEGQVKQGMTSFVDPVSKE